MQINKLYVSDIKNTTDIEQSIQKIVGNRGLVDDQYIINIQLIKDDQACGYWLYVFQRGY